MTSHLILLIVIIVLLFLLLHEPGLLYRTPSAFVWAPRICVQEVIADLHMQL